MVQNRHYTPGPASVQDLQGHLSRQGLGRAVIVQPSVYGTDNSCLLAAIAAMGQQARGIAVLDPQVSRSEILELNAQGIRGIRLNLESSGNQSIDELKQALMHWAPKLEGLGWHIQVYAPFNVTAACAICIQELPIPVVLDHFALWPANQIASQETSIVLDLLAEGHVYIKLSASYRLPAFEKAKLKELAHQLLHVRSDRLLWASDWPHTNREQGVDALSVSRYRQISTENLLSERSAWLINQAQTQLVLVDNPSQLYSFGSNRTST
jgi:predicted TIM-barrel fold metal-dependent hydrolase